MHGRYGSCENFCRERFRGAIQRSIIGTNHARTALRAGTLARHWPVRPRWSLGLDYDWHNGGDSPFGEPHGGDMIIVPSFRFSWSYHSLDPGVEAPDLGLGGLENVRK